MNNYFQQVFSEKWQWEKSGLKKKEEILRDTKVEVQEVKNLLENHDVRKASGPDGVLN